MQSDDQTPYWVLISVLFSTRSLTEGLALALHQVAWELYRTGRDVGQLDRETEHGQVKNLKKEVLLGTSGGPMFEAELETAAGKSQVRFLLTRQGIELMHQQQQRSAPRYLN